MALSWKYLSFGALSVGLFGSGYFVSDCSRKSDIEASEAKYNLLQDTLKTLQGQNAVYTVLDSILGASIAQSHTELRVIEKHYKQPPIVPVRDSSEAVLFLKAIAAEGMR